MSSQQITDHIKNRLMLLGDNAKFLRQFPDEFVDLIVTDPPYNTLRNFTATTVSKVVEEGYADRVQWNPQHHRDFLAQCKLHQDKRYVEFAEFVEWLGKRRRLSTAAFVCFLGYRLFEMHRMLKPTGSIFLQCDQTANSYIRVVMDVIFGEDNLINEVIWSYNSGGASDNRFAKKHDTIFWYGKTDKYYRDIPREPYATKNFPEDDPRWDARGRIMHDVWPLSILSSTSSERTGYPTQKPVPLFQRMIKAGCPEGGVVFDPFLGSGTTAIAAEASDCLWFGCDYYATSDIIAKRLEEHSRVLWNYDAVVYSRFSLDGEETTTTPTLNVEDVNITNTSREALKRELIQRANGICPVTGLKPAVWAIHRRRQGCVGGKYTEENSMVMDNNAHTLFHSTPEGMDRDVVLSQSDTIMVAKRALQESMTDDKERALDL